MIICSACGKERPHEAKGLCKGCYNHRQYAAHREERRVYGRHHYKKYQGEILARQCRYYQKNREKLLAQMRLRREANPDYMRLWREMNPDYYRRRRQEEPGGRAVRQARRRARKRNLPDTLTFEQAEHLIAIGLAMYPGQKLQLDHIVPLSRGGGTTLANMHAIPAWLNNSKYAALPGEIYKQGELI